MVQGLAIRRAFILVDLVLAALIATTFGMALQMIMTTVMNGPEPIANAMHSTDGMEPAKTLLPAIGPRGDYEPIIESGLFGEAGRFDPHAAPPPPPEPEPVEEDLEATELNLRLAGTIALTPKDPFASAFIEDKDRRDGAFAYQLGSEVVEQVTLVEVYPREVVLLNERKDPPKREVLTMDDEDSLLMASARNTQPPGVRVVNNGSRSSSASSTSTASRGGSNREYVSIDRGEFIQDLTKNYADLLRIRPTKYTDESGKVAGLTAEGISDIPLAQKLGAQDGDVLQSVNGEPIDSEQKVMEVIQKYRNATTFRIGILRNGQPMTVTYRLQ